MLLLYYPLFFYAQDSTVVKKTYTTKILSNNSAPIIDGNLNDKSWDIVEWATDFIESRPDENTPPNYQTKFKILYDKNFIYIAVRCFR